MDFSILVSSSFDMGKWLLWCFGSVFWDWESNRLKCTAPFGSKWTSPFTFTLGTNSIYMYVICIFTYVFNGLDWILRMEDSEVDDAWRALSEEHKYPIYDDSSSSCQSSSFLGFILCHLHGSMYDAHTHTQTETHTFVDNWTSDYCILDMRRRWMKDDWEWPGTNYTLCSQLVRFWN